MKIICSAFCIAHLTSSFKKYYFAIAVVFMHRISCLPNLYGTLKIKMAALNTVYFFGFAIAVIIKLRMCRPQFR